MNVGRYQHFSSNVGGATNNVYMHPKTTVDQARLLSSQGLNDCEVARRLGVSAGAVRKWRTGQRRAQGERFGLPRCPLCHGVPLDETAYSYLFGLYLGDGHITRHRRGVFALSISSAATLGPVLSQLRSKLCAR